MSGMPSGDELLKLINKNTIAAMTPRWTRNIVANEPILRKGKGIKQFFQSQTDNLPAIVVSAGPSVNKNLHLLKECVDKAVIIVVDSMLERVLGLGIKPNFVMMTDSEWGEWGTPFDNLPMDVKGIPLLVDVFINKKIIEAWKGDLYWYCIMEIDGNPLSQVIETEFTGHPIGKLACGGCVSSTAFSFAIGCLRCDPIIMIGQDCGYYDKEFFHGSGVKSTVPDYTGEEMVEDIVGRPMITTPALKAYAYWFEKIVSGRYNPSYPKANGTFINCTEGGIIKQGWLIQPFKFAIDKYLTKKYDINKLIFTPKEQPKVEPLKIESKPEKVEPIKQKKGSKKR